MTLLYKNGKTNFISIKSQINNTSYNNILHIMNL